MKTLLVEHMNRIKKAVPKLENRIKIAITFGKGSIGIKGAELNEYLAEEILRAVDFGFHIEDALLLLNQTFNLEFIDIKTHTRRKNLSDVRARVIGTNGKARKTIEKLTGAVLVINENDIGIIVDDKHLDATIQAIENLIRGAKHGNVFAYLEGQNITRAKQDEEDLGLKEDLA